MKLNIDGLFAIGLIIVGIACGALIQQFYYVYFIVPQVETLHDGLTSQSSHCSSITAISDKIRCLENRIDMMNATITELDN